MRQLLKTKSILVAGGAVAVVLVVITLTGSDAGGGPTFGTIPKAVFEAGAPADPADLPDYISVVGSGDDVLGYIPAAYAFPLIGHEEESTSDDPIPVVDTRLILIGHMVAGRGFVPLGTDVSDVPTILVTTTYGGVP